MELEETARGGGPNDRVISTPLHYRGSTPCRLPRVYHGSAPINTEPTHSGCRHLGNQATLRQPATGRSAVASEVHTHHAPRCVRQCISRMPPSPHVYPFPKAPLTPYVHTVTSRLRRFLGCTVPARECAGPTPSRRSLGRPRVTSRVRVRVRVSVRVRVREATACSGLSQDVQGRG